MKTRQELKAESKEIVKGKRFAIVLTSIVVLIATSALSFAPFGLGYILAIFITGGFNVSLAYMSLKVVKGEVPAYKDGDYGYKNRVGNNVSAYLLTCIYIFFWSLLLIIPGIVKFFAYSMTPFILAENPDMSANEAITLSKEMTKGYKKDLFMLDLSFIGWVLLSILTCGILLIWVLPYYQVCLANFYKELKKVNGMDKEEEATSEQV